LLLDLTLLVLDLVVERFEQAVLLGISLFASSVRRVASMSSRSARLCSVMSVITVTVPPAAARRRRIRYQLPSGA